jgi:hypothetical protein
VFRVVNPSAGLSYTWSADFSGGQASGPGNCSYTIKTTTVGAKTVRAKAWYEVDGIKYESSAESDPATGYVAKAFSPGAIKNNNDAKCPGATPVKISSTADAEGGIGAITYQWRNGTSVIGSTNNKEYTPANNLGVTNHTFYRDAKDATCQTTFQQSTNGSVLTVNANPNTPTLTSATVCQVSGASVNITANNGVTCTGCSYSTNGTLFTTSNQVPVSIASFGTINAQVWVKNPAGCTATLGPVGRVQVVQTPSAPTSPTLVTSPVCVGSSLVFRASTSTPTSALTWTSSPTGNPSGTGSCSYTVTSAASGLTVDVRAYISSSGTICYSTNMTTSPTVNANPSGLSLTPSPSAAVCQGTSAKLIAAPTTNGNKYKLNDSDQYGTAYEFTVNTTNSGAQSFALWVQNSAGCTATLASSPRITVNAIPSGLSLPTVAVCQNAVATIVANATTDCDGCQYSFTNGSTGFSTTKSTTVSNTTTGNTVISKQFWAKNGSGCTNTLTNTSAVQVSTKPGKPSISPSVTAVCQGGSANISVVGMISGLSFEWSDIFYGTGNSSVFTVNTGSGGVTASARVTATPMAEQYGLKCASEKSDAASVVVYAKPSFSNTNNLTQSKYVGQAINPINITVSNATAVPATSGSTVVGLDYSYTSTNTLAVSGTVGKSVGQQILNLTYKNTLEDCQTSTAVNITANSLRGTSDPNALHDQILHDGVIFWNAGRMSIKACADMAKEVVNYGWNLLHCCQGAHSDAACLGYYNDYLAPQGIDALLCVTFVTGAWWQWCCPGKYGWIDYTGYGSSTGVWGSCVFEIAIPQ